MTVRYDVQTVGNLNAVATVHGDGIASGNEQHRRCRSLVEAGVWRARERLERGGGRGGRYVHGARRAVRGDD